MPENNETWSERFAREVDAAVRLLRNRPLLGMIFVVGVGIYIWHQWPSKPEDRHPSTPGAAASNMVDVAQKAGAVGKGVEAPGAGVEQTYQPASLATVFIHVRSESQREKAMLIRKELERLGFFVKRITFEPQVGTAGANVIYWDGHDRNEAETIGRALEKLNILSRAKVVDRSHGLDEPVSRSYEVWF
ncbi:hypothetical protein [Chitinimonas sp.]|uniref:hypothetical protein n=1 Tax=Chitinimonas sp. TaxID=1934313 RepID=UPI002F949505